MPSLATGVETGGIDHQELALGDTPETISTITGQTRKIGYKGITGLGETVEQGGFAHIGASNQDEGGFHAVATPLFDVDGGDIAVARLDDDVAGCTLQVGKNRAGSSALAPDEGSIVFPEKVDIAVAIANHHVLARRQRTPGATACKQILFPGACATGNVERVHGALVVSDENMFFIEVKPLELDRSRVQRVEPFDMSKQATRPW
jgi:hypothetical protein